MLAASNVEHVHPQTGDRRQVLQEVAESTQPNATFIQVRPFRVGQMAILLYHVPLRPFTDVA